MRSVIKLGLEGDFQAHLENGKAIQIGSCAVASLKGHEHPGGGRVVVVTGVDAGRHYLGTKESGRTVHLDVLHRPQLLDPFKLAGSVWPKLAEMWWEEHRGLALSPEEIARVAAGMGRQILIGTALGEGSLPELFAMEAAPLEGPPRDRVHILIPLALTRYLLVLVDFIEEAICVQNGVLAPVRNIRYQTSMRLSRGHNSTPVAGVPVSLAGLDFGQVIVGLAAKLGSVSETESFLSALGRPSSFSLQLGQLVKRHGDLGAEIKDLEAFGLLRKGLLGYRLTSNGQEILQYLGLHRTELEAELRKLIRRLPLATSGYRRGRKAVQKVAASRVLSRDKVVSLPPHDWPGDIAVPETVMQATKRTVLQENDRLRIEREDLQIYTKKKAGNPSICLLIDGSASMIGDKIRAVRYLAEHLVLTTREKVAVVVFQEMQASVVVPFTRDFRRLQTLLAAVQPGGMTPLAKGIIKGLELIEESRVRNPLLMLITDGLPTFSHWTYDASKDALRAAGMIAEAGVKFACIGVQPNRSFLSELVREAGGRLYTVDNFDRESLVTVAAQERQSYRSN